MTKLHFQPIRGKSLDIIGAILQTEEVASTGKYLEFIHLATEEMQHLFDWKRVCKEVKVIQPEFLVMKNGKLKVVTVYAKSCRGAMTRFIIKNQLTMPEDLRHFEYEGFEYSSQSEASETITAGYGDASHPHFIID